MTVALHKSGTKCTGKFGYPIEVQKHIGDVQSHDFDAVICPGGFAPDYYRRDAQVKISRIFKGFFLAGAAESQ